MKAVTHLEKVITGEVSAVTHLEMVITAETTAVTYTEKVITGEAPPITHLQKVIAGEANPVTHLEHVWAGGSPTPTEHEYTGAVPYTFTADGSPLLDYLISGNMEQSGTPTPENPIIPSECGERTRNLYDKSLYPPLFGFSNNSGKWESNTPAFCSVVIPCEPNTKYVISKMRTNRQRITTYVTYPQDGDIGLQVEKDGDNNLYSDLVTAENAHYMAIMLWWDDGTTGWSERTDEVVNTLQVEIDVKRPSAYEPYGYKIPIISAGQTFDLYIGAEPLRKAIDGSDVADTITYSTQQLIRRVDSSGNALATPTTETIEVPELPTNNGSTTIDVDTAVKPSEIYIKYKGV